MTLKITAERSEQLHQWLSTLTQKYQFDFDTLQVASSDASFRSYYRIFSAVHQTTLIIMDAPPPHENCTVFVEVDQLLEKQGLTVPQIIEKDEHCGFLLLSDLGNTTYYQAVQTGLEDTKLQRIYREALDALVLMQQTPAKHLPAYDAPRLREEMNLFEEWYVEKHCQNELSEAEKQRLYPTLDALAAFNAQEPQVFVHRDFHSPNLMLIETEQGPQNPAIIDFQDALYGPLSYDLASLVMDARTTWDEPQQLDWAIRYWEKARAAGLPVPKDFGDFHRNYEAMSLQRNLRILGVFARLAIRDNKKHYLDHIPRVLAYIRQVANRYHDFAIIARILDRLENITVEARYTF
ncbi:N-acetylmuramate/N-acetylglucosamine kinase [Oligella sp. MSHR50489EDL]|uniref:aminoglycoside phosphotransferase family protein n=1 Tax=Oligella sp. MSHR50489EDL TaxID=3139409 RepID=UPI003D8170A4